MLPFASAIASASLNDGTVLPIFLLNITDTTTAAISILLMEYLYNWICQLMDDYAEGVLSCKNTDNSFIALFKSGNSYP
jgi:hypothetical protein